MAAVSFGRISQDPKQVVLDVSVGTAIKKLIPSFQRRQGKFISETVQRIQVGGAYFYGIHRKEQDAADFKSTAKRYAEIKSHLLANMGLSADTPIYEVVGDSAAFSASGTEKAMRFLEAEIPAHAVICYGYTGHDEVDGTKCVNAAVSALAMQPQRQGRVIGNLVGFHTPIALESWKCTGPQLEHYTLVYGEDESRRETGTVFGDDITTTDFISDKLLMQVGGIQSFRQACNFLLLQRPILALSGLRGDKTRFAILEDGSRKNYFDATEFLQFLKEKVAMQQEEISNALLDAWYSEYLSIRLLADPKRGDYDTKKKLLDDAWKLFKDEKLYKRLELFRT